MREGNWRTAVPGIARDFTLEPWTSAADWEYKPGPWPATEEMEVAWMERRDAAREAASMSWQFVGRYRETEQWLKNERARALWSAQPPALWSPPISEWSDSDLESAAAEWGSIDGDGTEESPTR